MEKNCPLVALAIMFNNRILAGIAKYLASHERWRVIEEASEFARSIDPDEWSRFFADGLIAEPLNDSVRKLMISRPDIKTVLITDLKEPGIPTVSIDNEDIGRMGAEYLIERGYEQLAWFGMEDYLFSRQRGDGFMAAAREHGIEPMRLSINELSRQFASGTRAQTQQIIRSLPKPAAFMACTDTMARRLSRDCFEADIPVPEDVAILGVDNDDLLCNLHLVPLSSVDPNHEEVGYRAAELMDQVMRGEDVGEARRFIKPKGVVTRRSTDIFVVDDPMVRQAMRFLHDHVSARLSIEQIADAVGVSRRTLDRRFLDAVDRTPADELLLIRLKRAQKLLRNTSLTIPEVAEKAGFTDHRHQARCFRRKYGMSPGQYRKKHSIG